MYESCCPSWMDVNKSKCFTGRTTQETKNGQSSKTSCRNESGSVVNKSEAEMAREEKSTGDIIALIFKGQKSVKLFVSHFRDEKTGM